MASIIGPPPAEFEREPAYPLVYRPTPVDFWWQIACATLLIAGGVSNRNPANPALANRTFLQTLAYGMIAFGFVLLADLWRARLVLDARGIKIRTLTATRVLAREDIAGWWRSPLRFVLRSGEAISMARLFEPDWDFEKWARPLEDLDRKSRARRGVPPPAGRFLNWLTLAVALWALVYPKPKELVMLLLVVLPILTFAAKVVERRGHGGGGALGISLAGFVFLLPGFVLLWGTTNLFFRSNAGPIWALLFVGVIFWQALVLADPDGRVPLAVSALLYGFGLSVWMNTALDRSPALEYQTDVMRMYIRNGRSAHYDLALRRMEPWPNGLNVDVGKSFYQATKIGDKVCLTLQQGALGSAWYTVHGCPPPIAAPQVEGSNPPRTAPAPDPR